MKKKITSPNVADPPPQTWSNCLVVGNQVYVAGMVARGSEGAVGGDSMYGQAQAIFAKIKHLMEAAGGTMNDIVKVLTIASVVGIPPILVVGIYGMNFKYMPELNWAWGYPFALVLIAVSIALPLLWFKMKDWM